MIIEIKVPAMSAVDIARMNEDLNQVVYNHTGVSGESKLSNKTELEERYAKLLEALNRLLEYGDRMVELYRDSVEKIKSDEGKTEEVKIFQMRLSQGKFYGWRDSMKFLRQVIQQSETK